ncbi:MAG TPA: zf-HC2 domain-containing protein [Pyrinomonadaceae bacterium]|nr:zf-HC2 domain-containing protein [Pyrinomonadaceae bacterium]
MNCGREEELVSFLYGELNSAEKAEFHRHLATCTGCKSQLMSFTDLRESVVAWRNETIGTLTPAVSPRPVVIDRPQPSAWAAIREFFNLSPLWMKGSVAFASLLFCLLAVLAVARFNQTSPVNNVASNSDAKSSQEFDAAVERRVKEELQRREAVKEPSPIAVAENPDGQSTLPVKRNKRPLQSASAAKVTRPLSKLERQELAADLRLTEEAGDLDLILIGDRINQ